MPIGYIARFNLMQVAQILQMLAMRKYQEIDGKVSDLYDKFHSVSFVFLYTLHILSFICIHLEVYTIIIFQDSVSSFLDRILGNYSETLDEPPPNEDNTEIEGILRSAALFTHCELNNLVIIFFF